MYPAVCPAFFIGNEQEMAEKKLIWSECKASRKKRGGCIWKPAWVEQVENLLVALEMYRIEEEKAISHLSDILTAYGIDVSAEEIRSTKAEEIRTTIREKAEVR